VPRPPPRPPPPGRPPGRGGAGAPPPAASDCLPATAAARSCQPPLQQDEGACPQHRLAASASHCAAPNILWVPASPPPPALCTPPPPALRTCRHDPDQEPGTIALDMAQRHNLHIVPGETYTWR